MSAMLLNELQKQAREDKELRRENRELQAKLAQVHAEQTRERVGFDERRSSLERTVRADAREATLSTAVLQQEIGAESPILR